MKIVSSKFFLDELKKNNISFFTGVPDSLLKDFCSCLVDNTPKENHIIAANEGGAIALASGYNIATSNFGLVYLQNSGLGNITNPITSLVDKEVYSIPMLLLIGWRGEPGINDAPQHVKQGKITLEQLSTLGIPYEILESNNEMIEKSIKNAIDHMEKKSEPYAFIVRKNLFEKYSSKISTLNNYTLSRENAIKLLVKNLSGNEVFVSTTGKISRELFETRENSKLGHSRDFLTVGSMGHSSQIALGIALQTTKDVYCIDGDGALIMHSGALGINGNQNCSNFRHIILNNGAHESVGGQETIGFNIDIPKIAKGFGYNEVFVAESEEELKEILPSFKSSKGPSLLEIRVALGSRKDLGRPTISPIQNKINLMQYLEESK